LIDGERKIFVTKINIFDRTLKIISRNYADCLLRLAFPNIPIRLIGTLENIELSLPVQPVDFVHRIEDQGQEHILHIEFQLEHENEFPRRMCSYYGALTKQFDLPVVTLALYLRPRKSPIPNEYVVTLGEQVVNRFTYPVLKLWDYVEEIKSGKHRELAPLLVTLVGEPDQTVLNQERDLILEEPDSRNRANLLAMAVTMAARYFDKAFLWRFFREELEQMREATFIEDWIEEGVQQGKQIGIQQGKQIGKQIGIQKGRQQGIQEGIYQGQREGSRQAHRENILQVLKARFNLPRPEIVSLDNQLKDVEDLDTLKKLFSHALRDITAADFNARLEEIVN
jgi:predicted transposase YdaD